MLALVQRVGEASVRVGGELIGKIGQGLLVFVCAERGDADDDAARLLQRVLRLRCFGDEAGRMNRSVQDVGGGLLHRGNGPTAAGAPQAAVSHGCPRARPA